MCSVIRYTWHNSRDSIKHIVDEWDDPGAPTGPHSTCSFRWIRPPFTNHLSYLCLNSNLYALCGLLFIFRRSNAKNYPAPSRPRSSYVRDFKYARLVTHVWVIYNGGGGRGKLVASTIFDSKVLQWDVPHQGLARWERWLYHSCSVRRVFLKLSWPIKCLVYQLLLVKTIDDDLI